ncbi:MULTISPECIES: hypothetical protein [unclassified Micromonospora]|uniref:hypothetical protein n=1 Tax=unclassified Micromonospora TaxID=2617518 RepID=UPI0036426F03
MVIQFPAGVAGRAGAAHPQRRHKFFENISGYPLLCGAPLVDPWPPSSPRPTDGQRRLTRTIRQFRVIPCKDRDLLCPERLDQAETLLAPQRNEIMRQVGQ